MSKQRKTRYVAADDVKVFAGYLEALVKLSLETLGRPRLIAYDDHVGFMHWCFSAKMTYHAQSVLALAHRHGLDAGIVARTMLEGLGIWTWAKEDSARAEEWRAFHFVEQYRWYQQRAAEGRAPDADVKEQIRAGLERYAPRFLKGQRTKLPTLFTLGSELSFRRDWWPPDKGERWKDHTDVKELLDAFYSNFSLWIHWNPSAINAFLESKDGKVVVRNQTHPEAAIALMIGCRCLRLLLYELNQRLRLRIKGKLISIDRGHLRDRMRGATSLE